MYLMHSASKLGVFAEVICCASHSLETSCWDQLLIDRSDVGPAASMPNDKADHAFRMTVQNFLERDGYSCRMLHCLALMQV